MPDLPPTDLTAVEAPERPQGGVATRLATSVSSEGYGVDPEAPGVRYGWLRLVALLGVLALVGFWKPQMLLVILAIMLMITLHELGHYLMAKRAGMKVTEFFLGFGPKIWSVRRGETEYGIKVIPAGAYVKIPGMVNLDEVAPEDEARTYRQKSFGSRVSVAVAGSAMHFLLALILLYVSAVFIGQPADAFSTDPASPPAIVQKVHAGSGADEAGLAKGDRIRTVDGTPTPTSEALREASAPHYGETVPVTFVRDGQAVTVPVTLGAYSFTQPDGSIFTTCGMGITMAGPQKETVGPIEGLVKAPQQFGQIFTISMKGLGSFFSPSGISSFGSQVGSAHEDREQAKETKADNSETCAEKAAAIAKDPSPGAASSSGSGSGENRILSIYGLVQFGSSVDVVSLVTLFALINIFIGIFNLVPLLPFDGGHVAIAVYENIQEKRLHRRRYFADVTRLLPLTYGVVVVLGLLFVSSLYLDVVNPIG
ncbi:M50 family metallopeptidase [Aquihabitans daechungensis]|uniref:M50 family metallopeptidase n=1 Tax=Aquihabitans daechungensis TaxID=1052257 RepID=UPI003BA03250